MFSSDTVRRDQGEERRVYSKSFGSKPKREEGGEREGETNEAGERTILNSKTQRFLKGRGTVDSFSLRRKIPGHFVQERERTN